MKNMNRDEADEAEDEAEEADDSSEIPIVNPARQLEV